MNQETQVFEHIVCPFCGCLCDDIRLEVEGNQITNNDMGCAISKAKFMSHHEDRIRLPNDI
jgi:formylmethanofuran dehydrogenase subunit B